jgi:predicted transcriptional regulator YdeE
MQAIRKFKLIGLALKNKTTNEKGQSAIDCGNLWQKFQTEGIYNKITGKLTEEVFAVYHSYEGNYTKPFSYFIGCKVDPDTKNNELERLIIDDGNYRKFTAKGKMPDCIGKAWDEIWKSGVSRAYKYDFEVYGEKSKDWNNAEVDIYISVK